MPTRQTFSQKLSQLKQQAFATDYPMWRKMTSTVFLSLACIVVVGTAWYLYLATDGLECQKGFFLLSLPWLIAELMVIAYMFYYSIPRVIRASLEVIIGCSNIWFGLFIFSLKACGA
ncbi:hypothetical protein [Gynuella sunshinyii]|uniref:Uncharacterized protein n=1 Tax=Gynuella sunshinyii YC6258 TaxID=1445510 RepID=A0A0C5VP08_9GAMM|nr:hypothetical protein [Gynuella sunshinyii]AJQ96026.1 hypothetical Protein YC6258_03990 [Gynuella sunshinyii YC6258]